MSLRKIYSWVWGLCCRLVSSPEVSLSETSMIEIMVYGRLGGLVVLSFVSKYERNYEFRWKGGIMHRISDVGDDAAFWPDALDGNRVDVHRRDGW